MKIVVHGRLSFPNLFAAKSVNGSAPKFGAAIIVNKTDTATLDQIRKAISEVSKAKWPKGTPKGMVPALRDGGLKEYDGYGDDVMFFTASSKDRPPVVNRKRMPVAEGDAQCPYAGCYVNVSVTFWAQDNQFGKRVNAQLNSVQFVKDGEPFGSSAPINPEEEFKEVPEDDVEFDVNG